MSNVTQKTESIRKKATCKPNSPKPKKPYPGFPLQTSTNGYWQKRIRGKLQYFGRWGRKVNGKMERLPNDGWVEALELYKAQAEDLHAGRVPKLTAKSGGTTVMEMCNQFMQAKLRQLEVNELSQRSFDEYKGTGQRLVDILSKNKLLTELTPADFARFRQEIAKMWGPVRLGNEIQRVRTIFKYAYESKLIEHPQLFGPEFRKPSRAVLRKHRASKSLRLFEVVEIGEMLAKASTQLKAMILLGINAGMGNADVGNLPLKALDMQRGWVTYPRPKTGIERRCALWPETLQALRESFDCRPEPKADESLRNFKRWSWFLFIASHVSNSG